LKGVLRSRLLIFRVAPGIDMRIYQAFLVMMTTAILFLLPVSAGIYDFRTDVREDSFSVTTGVGVTSANVTLIKALYDDDISTATALSDNTTDTPTVNAYNTVTRALTIGGLQSETTRGVTVSYDVYALTGGGAIDTLISRIDLIWLICLIAFPAVALAAIFVGRA